MEPLGLNPLKVNKLATKLHAHSVVCAYKKYQARSRENSRDLSSERKKEERKEKLRKQQKAPHIN